MLRPGLVLCWLWVTSVASLAQGPPLFTADFYLTNPEAYLGKKVTLAIAYLRPRNEGKRRDGLRQLDAYTYNQNRAGGHLSILAPADTASKLVTLCGTTMQFTGAGVRFIMIQGKFSQEEDDGAYYLLAD